MEKRLCSLFMIRLSFSFAILTSPCHIILNILLTLPEPTGPITAVNFPGTTLRLMLLRVLSLARFDQRAVASDTVIPSSGATIIRCSDFTVCIMSVTFSSQSCITPLVFSLVGGGSGRDDSLYNRKF